MPLLVSTRSEEWDDDLSEVEDDSGDSHSSDFEEEDFLMIEKVHEHEHGEHHHVEEAGYDHDYS